MPQFPLEGVREAVLNALTHRDCLNPGEVLVRHSTGELVVTSPGGFAAGITPDNILRHEAVKLLQDLGIVSELTGQKKNRLFSYAAYVELLAGSPWQQ